MATIDALLISLLFATTFAHPQVGPRNKSDETIKLSTELVALDARVLNKNTRRFVGGLGKEDFELYEDGKRQQITHFSQDTPPLSIVFLLDQTTHTFGAFTRVGTNLEETLRRLRPDDQAALMVVGWDITATPRHLDWNIWLPQPFTKDRQLFTNKNALSPWIGIQPDLPPMVAHAATKHQAIYEAALLLERDSSPNGRRVVITLTDDVPWWTRRRADNLNIFSGNKKDTIGKDDLSTRLLTSEASFSALVIPAQAPTARIMRMKGMNYNPIMKATSFVLGYNHYEYAEMGFYAEQTGGERVLTTRETASAQLAEMIDNLFIHYSFGYVSSNPKRDGKLRKINLKVSPDVEKGEGEVDIITRKGYYARRSDKTPNTRRDKAPVTAKP